MTSQPSGRASRAGHRRSLTGAAIALGVVLATAAGARAADTRAADRCPAMFYGAYSIGTKGAATPWLGDRLRELQDLGGNMVVATGPDTDILPLLPEGMLAVPGCGLMKKRDWQKDGQWDEAHAREKLAKLATRFAHDPRVYGICLTHEITEFADHARRVWMYKLAKEYFPNKKVIHYYGTIYDQIEPGKKVYGYGLNGEVETDVFFVSLPAASKDGHFEPDKAKRLQVILENAARTPSIPVWGQTSINADHKYVKGPETMVTIWGEHGERMKAWADMIFPTVYTDAHGRTVRLTGFFWRSFGRFAYDLGYPDFTAQRAQVREVRKTFCSALAPAAAPASRRQRAAEMAPPRSTDGDGHPGPQPKPQRNRQSRAAEASL